MTEDKEFRYLNGKWQWVEGGKTVDFFTIENEEENKDIPKPSWVGVSGIVRKALLQPDDDPQHTGVGLIYYNLSAQGGGMFRFGIGDAYNFNWPLPRRIVDAILQQVQQITHP